LLYEITQCYLPPDTGERAQPYLQPDRMVLYSTTPKELT